MLDTDADLTSDCIGSFLLIAHCRVGMRLTLARLLRRDGKVIPSVSRWHAERAESDTHTQSGTPIHLRGQRVFPHGGIMRVTAQGPTKNNAHRVRQGPDRVFQRRPCVFRCNAHAVSPHRGTDERRVRWHQSGGERRLATPLATPPVSSTRETASDRDGRGDQTASAIMYAEVRGLATAPSPPGCPRQHRGDTFSQRRGQTVIFLPWWAVFLWTHRQGDAFACQMRPLLHTFCAGEPGRCP